MNQGQCCGHSSNGLIYNKCLQLVELFTRNNEASQREFQSIIDAHETTFRNESQWKCRRFSKFQPML